MQGKNSSKELLNCAVMQRQVFFFLLIISFSFTKGQSWQLLESNPPHYYRYQLIDSQNHTPLFFPAVPYSSFAIRAEEFSKFNLLNQTEEMAVSIDPHSPEDLSFSQSIQYFVVDDGPWQLINKSGKSCELLLFFAPKIQLGPNGVINSGMACPEPPSIPQSVWRAGLPAPTVLPAGTPTSHIIVHHSAGSNTESDPTALVRDIYLLHTQGNGWDDVGYNYLIARNGTVFLGRDPQGQGLQDEIRGAHYCGKNTNTLGICLIGNYVSATPPNAMLVSLRNLTRWKMNKDGIDATGQSQHPLGDTAALWLYHLDGHRSGCATTCPGDQVYNRLSSLRDTLAEDIRNCWPTGISRPISAEDFMVYSVDGGLVVDYQLKENGWYHLIDLQGRIQEEGHLHEGKNTLTIQQNQLFILQVSTQKGTQQRLVFR